MGLSPSRPGGASRHVRESKDRDGKPLQTAKRLRWIDVRDGDVSTPTAFGLWPR
jgi:hypothetical protein